MNDYERKYTAAVSELKDNNISNWSAEPPLTLLLKKAGFNVRPPHYSKTLSNTLSNGTSFGIIWWSIMYFWIWRETLSLQEQFLTVTLASLFFGVSMALVIRFKGKRCKLSNWQDL